MKYVSGYFNCKIGTIVTRRKFDGVVKNVVRDKDHWVLDGTRVAVADIIMMVDIAIRKPTANLFTIPHSNYATMARRKRVPSPLELDFIKARNQHDYVTGNLERRLGVNEAAKAVLTERLEFIDALVNVTKTKPNKCGIVRCIREQREVFEAYHNALIK